jgi:hypothetical protein
MKIITNCFRAAFVAILCLAGCATERPPHNWTEFDAAAKRGEEICRRIAAMTREEIKSYENPDYGSTVAFYCWPARCEDISGAVRCACNDGVTGKTNFGESMEGFYIRVVTKSGKSLTPRHCAGWEFYVRGKIINVYPSNRVIVLLVRDEDYWIGPTT